MANYRAHHEAAPSDQMRLVDRLAHAIASVVATPPVHFIALLGLCAAYIQGGLTKLLDFNAAVAEAQNFGLPFAAAVAGATIVTELAGSALILAGVYRWLGALWLAGFTLVASLRTRVLDNSLAQQYCPQSIKKRGIHFSYTLGSWVPSCRGFGIAKILKRGSFTLAKAVRRMSVQNQRTAREEILKTRDQPQRSQLAAPSRADSRGKPDGPPDRTGPLRLLRSVNARAARYAVFMAPIVLTACQPAVLDPQGVIGKAEKMLLIDSLAIMLVIAVPTIAATFAFAWWFRASNARARYLPDWAYSGRIELIVWGIPLLVIMLLGGVTWIASHELDPAKPLASNTPPLEVQVVSLDWKWLFIYPNQGVASVNQLVVPAGAPIHFSLTSASVMNAFFIPQLGSMIYTMNGMTTQLNLQADAPGTFRGLSSHFSGDGFSDMHFDVLALPAERFNAWVEAARSTGPTLDPDTYAALARQSTTARPFTFRAVAPGLFPQIVTQKLPPGPGPRTGRPHPSVSPRTEE